MAISVIIPVYNTSIFLKQCLDSVLNQTYGELEIICINDGSTDNSLEILEEYKKKDLRIKIINQKNAGPSSARNAGIKQATGEYIAFIDSDDWIDANFFEKLHAGIVENNADIATATILRKYPKYQKARVKYEKTDAFTSLDDKIKACGIPKCCYIWNKLYKASIVRDMPFAPGAYYEDVLWVPKVIKKANKLVCVPNTNYYYRANSASIVKKKQSLKKQRDSYNAKKFIISFFKENNLELTKKQKTVTKKIYYAGNFVILKIKESENVEIFNLFGFIPVFKKKIKLPVIKDNTFIVWEPCSISHSEVVPGFCKYLLDLNYHVSVIVHPNRYKEGLFSRFDEKNISYNKLSKKEARNYFKNNLTNDVKGVMVTTVGKLCDCVHYNQAYSAFSPNFDKSKLLFVEHEASFASDKGTFMEDLITLRPLNYNNEKSVVVNPHYFGKIDVKPKNDVTNFIMVGAIRPNKRNSNMIVEAACKLLKDGFSNFKITVVGKGDLAHIPSKVRKYIDIKGRLPFDKMYNEIDKADFFLMPYNENDPEHIRYNTSGTSGNFQLIYGFLKPCILIKSFAPINGLDETNSILYEKDEDFYKAMEAAINIDKLAYSKMRDSLKALADKIYQTSSANLKALIEKGTSYGK